MKATTLLIQDPVYKGKHRSWTSILVMGPFVAALAFSLIIQASCSDRTVRSGDIRAVLGEADPGFWPSRGRRGGSDEEAAPEPPFWAHRGRQLQLPPCRQPSLLLLQREEMEPWTQRTKRQAL